MTRDEQFFEQLEADLSPKVYCAHCEFYGEQMAMGVHKVVIDVCHHPRAFKLVDAPIAPVRVRTTANDRNSHNDCADFQPRTAGLRATLRRMHRDCPQLGSWLLIGGLMLMAWLLLGLCL